MFKNKQGFTQLDTTNPKSDPSQKFWEGRNPKYNRTGFTVVEMLVVLLIIGILAMTIVTVVTSKTTDARYTQAVADLDALRSAITLFQIDLGYLPPSSDISTNTYGNAVLLKALTASINTTTPNWRGPYLDVKKMRLSTDEKVILDPWEHPYSYIIFSDYTSEQDWRSINSTAYFGTYNSNSVDIYENPLTYQLFSMGKNGYSNETAGAVANTDRMGTDKDDVNNWYGDERNR
jgi:general secretion pathway protein G